MESIPAKVIPIVIHDDIRRKRVRLPVPVNRDVEYLIDDLVIEFELPARDLWGRPVEYDLIRASNHKRLNPAHTLERIGIRSGEGLILRSPVARRLKPLIDKLQKELEDAIIDELWERAAEKLSELDRFKVRSKRIDELRRRIPPQVVKEPAALGLKLIVKAILSQPAAIALPVGAAVTVGAVALGIAAFGLIVTGNSGHVGETQPIQGVPPTMTPPVSGDEPAFTSEPALPTAGELPTEVTTMPTVAGPGCTYDMRYVGDVTVPDGTQMSPGEAFTKTWTLRNAGTCPWDQHALVFYGGQQMGGPASVPVAATAPGGAVQVSVRLTAPTVPGTYTSRWTMSTPDGALFGDVIHARIVVPGPTPIPTATPTPTITPSPTIVTPSAPKPIVFVSDRDGNNEIYVMNLDGTQPTRLTSNPASDTEPAWSPDRSKIAFVSTRDAGTRDIYVMNADGSGVTRLTTDPRDDYAPDWSPDGSQIVFASVRDEPNPSGCVGIFSCNIEIYRMNANGSSQTRLTNSAFYDAMPAWSPSGASIAFSSARNGGFGDLYIMNSSGGSVTRLTTADTLEYQPVWSPAGDRIMYVSRACPTCGESQIYSMNAPVGGTPAPPGAVSVLTDPTLLWIVEWAPFGSRFIFESSRNGNMDIFTANTDGSGLSQLTTNAANDSQPDWFQP